ncbi:MAG: DegV family protein [Acholeplasmatales bacterium]|nr:DegV family protein [Acholeplasmatales bacterium]
MQTKIKIITDNGCDLEKSWLDSNDIHLIKFGLIIGEEEFEGETSNDISIDKFYEKLKDGAMPKTAQINPYTATAHIEPFLKEGYDILYLSFSSGLSGSCNSVKLAAEQLKDDYPNQNIYVVDTLCASLGQGLFIDYVVKYINQGKSFDEIVKYAEELKWMIRHELTVDDLFHLKRGGRIGVVSAIFGSMLSIKPIINVNDEGKLIPFSKIRGRNSSIRALQEYFIKYNDITEDDPIFISHSNCYEEACKLKAMIQEIKPNNKIYINFIGPIIGSHTGQGTIALFYKGKSREL